MNFGELELSGTQKAGTLSPKYLEILSHIDSAIEDLEAEAELSANNVQCLTRHTRHLHNDLLTNGERARIASDFRRSVEQVLAFSAVGDQILSKSRDICERFTEELHNVSFDFCDFRAFKYPALRDAEGSLEHLSQHGYRSEVAPLLRLLKVRILQFTLYDGAAKLLDAIAEMAIGKTQTKEPTRADIEALEKQVDEARAESMKLLAKSKRSKDKLRKEREMNGNLVESLQRTREQFETQQRKWQLEIERRDKELATLRNVAHDRIILQREVENLRAQLAVQKERADNLQAKYDALTREAIRL